ncbi:GNAT family N-acetyltransferase [Kocuria sp. HSID17590]|uniref:GNAT family N-acetyltransferase n=1 Tax=Kocuria sp. HSID17590 TaxID=2419513 RepID=UPI00352B6765
MRGPPQDHGGTCGQTPVCGIGPVSVAPERQWKGIGSRLMTELIRLADPGPQVADALSPSVPIPG